VGGDEWRLDLDEHPDLGQSIVSSAAPLMVVVMTMLTKLASCRGDARKRSQLSQSSVTMWLALTVYNDVDGIAVVSR
jgi:hypothetical protein